MRKHRRFHIPLAVGLLALFSSASSLFRPQIQAWEQRMPHTATLLVVLAMLLAIAAAGAIMLILLRKMSND